MDIDLTGREPIYMQLKSELVRQIMLGILQVDDQVPTARDLARDLGINPNNVHKAYRELEEEGILYTIRGKGSFVALGQDSVESTSECVWRRLDRAIEVLKSEGIGDKLIHSRVDHKLRRWRHENDRSEESDEAFR